MVGSVFVVVAGMALLNKVATVSMDQRKLEQRLIYYNVAQSVASAVASMSSDDLYQLLDDEEKQSGEALSVGMSVNEQEWIGLWFDSTVSEDKRKGIKDIYLYVKVYQSISPQVSFNSMSEISSGDELREYHKEIIAEVLTTTGPPVEHIIWVEQEI